MFKQRTVVMSPGWVRKTGDRDRGAAGRGRPPGVFGHRDRSAAGRAGLRGHLGPGQREKSRCRKGEGLVLLWG